jgi:flagellar protein FlaI
VKDTFENVRSLFQKKERFEVEVPSPLTDPKLREKVRKKSKELDKKYIIRPKISDKQLYLDELNLMRKELEKDKMEVNFTYPVHPPYSFINITFDRYEGEMSYNVKEPKLRVDEEKTLKSIIQKMEIAMDQDEIPIKDDIVFGKSMELQSYIRTLFLSVLDVYNIKLEQKRRQILFYFVQRELTGWGRADPLLRDPFIEDISCNGPNLPIYVYHRGFGSMRTNVTYPNEKELNRYVVKLAQVAGRHISVYQPILDATLTDGSRINLTLGSEVTRKGSTYTIRKFSHDPISPIDLLRFGSISPEVLGFLWQLIDQRRSILVSGGTASGKTTLMNALCMFIRQEDKVVSIEDTAEIHIDHNNWIQSVSRAGYGLSKDDGGGSINLFDLLVAALRQRPEYVIVGEVRGKEAFTLFQAISVGHAAMATIHAGSIDELIHRVENEPMNIPRSLFQSLDVVVFQGMVTYRGKRVRRMMGVTEILELETGSKNLLFNDPYNWDPMTDAFNYSEKSYMIDKLAKVSGKTRKVIEDEIDQKVNFLKLMDSTNVTYFRDVSMNIGKYYVDPIKATIDLEQR